MSAFIIFLFVNLDNKIHIYEDIFGHAYSGVIKHLKGSEKPECPYLLCIVEIHSLNLNCEVVSHLIYLTEQYACRPSADLILEVNSSLGCMFHRHLACTVHSRVICMYQVPYRKHAHNEFLQCQKSCIYEQQVNSRSALIFKEVWFWWAMVCGHNVWPNYKKFTLIWRRVFLLGSTRCLNL